MRELLQNNGLLNHCMWSLVSWSQGWSPLILDSFQVELELVVISSPMDITSTSLLNLKLIQYKKESSSAVLGACKGPTFLRPNLQA